MRLQGKTALITGAGGTIGSAVAVRFAAEGASVALIDRDGEALRAVVDQLGPPAVGIVADVCSEADVTRYARETVERFGPVDVFFNNAGIVGPVCPLSEMAVDDFEAVMAVNVRGAFLGLKHVLPVMSDGGSAVVTSSVAGLHGSATLAAYVASKHAVMGLVKTAAQEVAPRRIRVNAINPGPVDGPMMRWIERGRLPSDPERSRAATTARMPLGRYLAPNEVADFVMFLASDESRSITGQAHVIDAGLTM